MQTWLRQLEASLSAAATQIPTTLGFLAIFWAVYFLSVLTHGVINQLGVYPRSIRGIPGIFLHSFLHENFNHIFFNSIPLFVLADFILIQGHQRFIDVTVSIILISGVLTWLFGRRAIHIGASSLVMGYLGYLLIDAYLHPSIVTVVLAVVCLYYFASLLFSIFPTREKISWEGHLFGLIAGLLVAFYFSDLNVYFHRSIA